MVDPDGLEALRLRERALRWEGSAARAQALAAELDTRRRILQDRLDEVRMRHQPEVWTSAAASRSRATLHQELAFRLWLVLLDLASTVRALTDAADEWRAAARSATQRVEELEARAGGLGG